MRTVMQLVQQACMPLASGRHLVLQSPPRLASFLISSAWKYEAGAPSMRAAAAWAAAPSRAVAASAAAGGSNSVPPGGAPLLLIIYSKPGCHLCDGLKEKLEALIDRAEYLPCVLTGARVEVRDITSNPAWEAAYAMTIPVLAAVQTDGLAEVEVPRPSPRLTADGLQKHIEKFLAAQQQEAQA